MAKNKWAAEAFKKAQNLMSRGYSDFQPTTVVTRDQLSDLSDAITTSRPLLSDNKIANDNANQPSSEWYKFPDENYDESKEATEEMESDGYAYTGETDIDEVIKASEDDLNKEWNINQPEDPNEKNSVVGEWWDNLIKDIGPDGGMGEGDDNRIAIAGEAISKLQKELNNLPTNTTPLTRKEREQVAQKRTKLKEQITEIRKKKQGYLKQKTKRDVESLKWSDDSNGAALVKDLKDWWSKEPLSKAGAAVEETMRDTVYTGPLSPTKHNNPGNIKKTDIKWDGEGEGGYGDGFTSFDTPEAGITAMTKDLTTKLDRHGGDLKKMIAEYAPAADGNDVKKYLQVVQKTAGKKYKYTKDDIENIVKGFIRMENKKDTADYYINIMDK